MKRKTLHELRTEIHNLLDDKFGESTIKKNMISQKLWLKRKGYTIHMSKMHRTELECLRAYLINEGL